MTPAVLSDADKYYLVENLWMEAEGGPVDPQAQRVYAVQSNIIDVEAPIWARSKVVDEVSAIGDEFGVRISVAWLPPQARDCAVEGPSGWVVEMAADQSHAHYRPLSNGEFLSSVALHECAHAFAPTVACNPARCNTPDFQSHGPEFVRCYLDLLARVMDTEKAWAAFAFLGVKIGSHSAGYHASLPAARAVRERGRKP